MPLPRTAAVTIALVLAACSSSSPATQASPPGPSATGAIGSPTTAPASPRSPTPPPSPTPVPKVPILTDAPVQSGLRIPWDLAFAPDGRMFVTERVGNILVFASGATNAPRIGHTSVTNMRAQGESGLMGIALDPDFARNGLVYVCASRIDEGQWRNQVLRYRASGNALEFDGYVIRTGMRAAVAHDGCTVRFGPDRKLWVSMGESTIASLAQDVNSLNGKILRVNTDGSIPDENPILPGATGRTAAYSYGHRNVQGIAFQDRKSVV